MKSRPQSPLRCYERKWRSGNASLSESLPSTTYMTLFLPRKNLIHKFQEWFEIRLLVVSFHESGEWMFMKDSPFKIYCVREMGEFVEAKR